MKHRPRPNVNHGEVSTTTDAGSYRMPSTTLDKHIARLALEDARKLIAEGRSPDEAAMLACKGAWSEWREYVLAQLISES